jgi:predicted transcriptional regulator
MSLSTTVTVRLASETKRKLDKLARATGRSKSFLTHHAILTYLETEAWQMNAIHEGLRQADAGGFIEHSAVKRKWEKKLARALDRAR